MKTLFKKNIAVLALVLASSTSGAMAQNTATLSEAQPVKMTKEQQIAYAEFLEMKKNARFSFQLTPEEYKMMKAGDAEGLKKSLGEISGTMQQLLATSITEEMQPDYTISTCDPAIVHARVIVTETNADGTTHSYELQNFEACPTIYNQIPNVDCMEVP